MRALSEALVELGVAHLGELNLLLRALRTGPREPEIVTKAVMRLSGRSDREPHPELYLEVALGIGLISSIGRKVHLTELGLGVYAQIGNYPLDRLTEGEVGLLGPELLAHPDLAVGVREVLGLASTSGKALVLQLASLDLSERQALGSQLLQVSGFAKLLDGSLVIPQAAVSHLWSILGEGPGLSEEELWEMQRETNERARRAEEYVVEFERRRLSSLGYPGLSRLVTRVSQTNARSSYDVRSFETTARPRFIEVKSATTTRVSFYWTEAERRFAVDKGSDYWIYFLPRAQDLPNPRFGLVLIQHPASMCGKQLVMNPSTYRVEASLAIHKTDVLDSVMTRTLG